MYCLSRSFPGDYTIKTHQFVLLCLHLPTEYIFRSTLRQSRPNKAGLKCPSICTCIRRSIRNEIWYVGRSRLVMQDGMQYDPIQGQGHEPFKVGNPAIFNSYLLCHLQWELATDHGFLNYGIISKFYQDGFLEFS